MTNPTRSDYLKWSPNELIDRIETLEAKNDKLSAKLDASTSTENMNSTNCKRRVSPARVNTAIIIDDSKLMQMRLKSALKKNNYNVVAVAENGLPGCDLVLEHKPGVVFLDYNMPEMDGLQTATEIRKVDDEVVIVVVSGEADPGIQVALMKAGVDDIILKPIDDEKLRQLFLSFVLPA